MNKYCFLITLSLISTVGFSQDTSEFKRGYFGVFSIGREIGDLTQSPNEIYAQSLFGYKFSSDFGIAAGPGFIHYDKYSFLPIIGTVRRNPSNKKRIGLIFDLGYMIPLRGEGEDFQPNYEITKGGSYFNPQISGLLYESKVLVYFHLGYRVYSFTAEYESQFNSQTIIEDRVTARFVNLGISIEIR